MQSDVKGTDIAMKIMFLGGGSLYIPIIIQEMVNSGLLIEEIVFVDTPYSKMETVVNYCKKIVHHLNIKMEMSNTIDEKAEGSTVIISIYRSRGGEGRYIDETLGEEFGILGQETQGIGGFSSAMRNIQVLCEYAPKIKKYCPKALLLNITNPSGIVTCAANKLGLKAIGICDAPYAMKKKISSFLQLDFNRMSISYFGLNHLGWITDIKYNGRSIISDVINREDIVDLLTYIKQVNIPLPLKCADFIKAIRTIPSSYLAYYYQTSEIMKFLKQSGESRARQVEQKNNMIFDIFKSGDISSWPDFFIKARGGYLLGEVVASFLNSRYMGKKNEHVICIKNDNYIDDMPADSVIEISAMVEKKEIIPFYEEVSPHIRGLVRLISEYEVLSAEAALEGDRSKAIQALTLHPLIREIDYADKLLDKIFTIYRNELPRFS